MRNPPSVPVAFVPLIAIAIAVVFFFIGAGHQKKIMLQEQTQVFENNCKHPKGSLGALQDSCPGAYKIRKGEWVVIFEDGTSKTVTYLPELNERLRMSAGKDKTPD